MRWTVERGRLPAPPVISQLRESWERQAVSLNVDMRSVVKAAATTEPALAMQGTAVEGAGQGRLHAQVTRKVRIYAESPTPGLLRCWSGSL